MTPEIEDLLYRSFDDELSENETERLKRALNHSRELRNLKAELLFMRQTLGSVKQERFSNAFVNNVLLKINSNPSLIEESDELIIAFKPIAMVASILILLMVSYNLIQSETLSLASAIGMKETSIAQLFGAVVPIF